MNTEQEDRITSAAASLRQDIEPGRDLWPDIEASISATPGRSRRPFYAQAAAVFLLVGASSAVTWFAMQQGPDVSPVATNPGLVLESTTWGGAHEMNAGYTLARNSVRERLDVELMRLSPESRADVEQNLQVIRDAITQINTALEAEPDNALLQDLLLRTYREELAVMQRVGGLTRNVMSRNDI